MLYVFFFKQKTAYEMRISDGSSDVCSSDLHANSQKRAVAMLEPVFGVLAWCVDEDLMDVPIDIGELGDCFDITRLCEFADPRAFPEMPSGIREGMARYLAGLPGYCEEFIWRPPPETVAHPDFVKRRVVSVLTRLAEDYPHILLGRQRT